jgi:hypothetical protein
MTFNLTPQPPLVPLVPPFRSPFRPPSKGGDQMLFRFWFHGGDQMLLRFLFHGRIQSLSPCRREVWREVFQIPYALNSPQSTLRDELQ